MGMFGLEVWRSCMFHVSTQENMLRRPAVIFEAGFGVIHLGVLLDRSSNHCVGRATPSEVSHSSTCLPFCRACGGAVSQPQLL